MDRILLRWPYKAEQLLRIVHSHNHSSTSTRSPTQSSFQRTVVSNSQLAMTDIAARIPAAASSFFQSIIPPPEDYLSCYKTHGAPQGKTGLLSSIHGVPSVAWE